MSKKTKSDKPQRYKMHVKKGDTVVVLSGKDKGKKGKVLEALPPTSSIIDALLLMIGL